MSNEVFPHIDQFAAQQNILRERFRFLLTPLHVSLSTDILKALQQEGKLFSIPPSFEPVGSPVGKWALLTLLVAQYISPEIDPQYASGVAIATECFICALDLLDDVEDGDQTAIVQALGEARVLNVSTALLALAQQAILSLAQLDVPTERILWLLNVIQESTLIATVGQHQDLLAEQRPVQDTTYEECIEIATGKAGALMSLACKLGVICAGADNDVYEKFAEIGELLGIAHQLDNDSHDLYHLLQDYTSAPERLLTMKSGKTDLVRNKKTLPVVLAADIDSTLQGNAWLADEHIEEHLKALQEGILSTWGICQLYRERARDRLQEVEAQRPIDPLLWMLLGL